VIFLALFGIHPNYQGRAIGMALIQDIISVAYRRELKIKFGKISAQACCFSIGIPDTVGNHSVVAASQSEISSKICFGCEKNKKWSSPGYTRSVTATSPALKTASRCCT
jgi:hypothetical protein